MDRLQQKFEKDLKNKLLLKTSGHMTEEILLFKTFKYFDIDKTGICDLNTFIQTMGKAGLYGFTETELTKLFYFYSHDKQKLDYKDFIGTVFNNASMKKKPEEEEAEEPPQNQQQEEEEKPEKDQKQEGEEELDPVEEILMKLRNKLSSRGLSNLIGIETDFREMDVENEQAINLDTFTKACEQFDFGLSPQDIKDLFETFDREETGTINYDEFVRVLRGELSDKRKELVDKVFQEITGGEESIPLEELFNKYEPSGSIECLGKKKVPEEEAMQIFVDTFKDNHLYLHGEEGANKPVDIEEFEDYYESASLMIPDDDTFKNVLLRSWGLIKGEPEPEPEPEVKEEKKKEPEVQEEKKPEPEVEEQIPQKHPPKEEKKKVDPYKAKREKEREFRRNLLDEQNLDNFRNIIGAKGIKTVMNFCNQLRQYDRKGDKEITYEGFADICQSLSLNLNEDEIKDLFNDFVKEPKKTLNYQEFLDALVGELNPRRKNVVLNAFKKLDIEKCEVINLSDIKSNFNSKNNPMVREGYLTEGDFYNNFMETFQTHHNLFRSAKIKKVNLEEFVDYYKFVSITIEDDYLFEEMLIACWKLSKSKSAHAGPKDNVRTLMNPQADSNLDEYSSTNRSKNNEKTEGEPSETQRRTAKKYFPSKHGSCPYGVDKEVTDYSNLLHPKGELVGIRLNRNDLPLEVFRKKIIARGIRGIMSLRRTFILYDENKNNKLSPEEFHKYIQDYRMPITPQEEEGIFKNFDKDKSGDIDYNEFVRTIVGQMNDYRRAIIEQVFDKLDKDKKGKIDYDTIRNNYNSAKHPEVLNGKRNAEEIMGRFIDLFEYHFNLLNPDKEKNTCDLNEFIEFYNNISLFIDDDKYFENVVSRVWELNNEINYAKGYRNLKRNKIF